MNLRSDANRPQPASVLPRALAFLLDWAIVLVLTMFLVGGFTDDTSIRLPALLILLSVYHIGFLMVAEATPGKMAMRMQVTDENGARLMPDRVILRYLIFFVGIFTLFIGAAISLVMMLSDPQRRTLHDRIANSLVVKARPSEERDRSRNV
jgi:uncharacterized RDD family membrane protein YckC